MTTTVRLAVKVAQSARARHEMYVGPWLPESVDTSVDPYLGAECDDALELAVLVLLEKLSPNERASYVLREAFDCVTDPNATYYGIQVSQRSLTPDHPAQLGHTRYNDWLGHLPHA
jgi:hypothetical protein